MCDTPDNHPTETPDAEPVAVTCECFDRNAEECDCYYCDICEKHHDPDQTARCSECQRHGVARCSDSCDENPYYCEECQRDHHADDRAYCESCASANGRRHRFVCSDRCDRCFYCEGCGESHMSDYTSQCDNCQCCTDRHDCSYCESCSEYVDDLACGDCNQCESCGCECQRRGVELVRNPLRFHKGKSHIKFPSLRFVAAEIEVASAEEARYVNRVARDWSMSVVEDGSIPDSGFEINTAPASGCKFVEQVEALTGALEQQSAEVNAACGLHVHVNAQDYRWRDWSKLLWLYQYLEDEVYKLVPASRRDARWCERRGDAIRAAFGDTGPMVSWSDQAHKSRVMAVASCVVEPRPVRPSEPHRSYWMTDEEYERVLVDYGQKIREYESALAAYAESKRKGCLHPVAVLRTCKAVTRKRDRSHARSGAGGGGRYFGLNLQAMFEHGTVEIRIHGGTVEFDKIVAWASLWANIVDFAAKASLDDILTTAKRGNAWEVLMEIAPPAWREFLAARRAKFSR